MFFFKERNDMFWLTIDLVIVHVHLTHTHLAQPPTVSPCNTPLHLRPACSRSMRGRVSLSRC